MKVDGKSFYTAIVFLRKRIFLFPKMLNFLVRVKAPFVMHYNLTEAARGIIMINSPPIPPTGSVYNYIQSIAEQAHFMYFAI